MDSHSGPSLIKTLVATSLVWGVLTVVGYMVGYGAVIFLHTVGRYVLDVQM